ncbi:Filamentous hemagglutinin [Serratia proteamaculans]|uniref:two-partner secretion domain-containing protein n=2 Tax=Serratia proteamaculans TaxID=28151 RepID=UPI00217BD868|nr:hemagglutinin repeat-containing protein [Serratia proteamaculans]CAI1757357.1 Filamentous hemagglutinin [Serratia proteamaculans]
MNKNLYRIVFNKARGMLMVVADIARSGRAGSARSPGLGQTLSQCIGKISAVSFSLLIALGAIQPVQAAIIADGNAPGGQQPTIVNSANGTPQVNIQTPSAGGVSRNTYSQFDVDKQGAILNNSHKMTQTQQGGWVDGNPWLAKGEAKVILNEVNSRDPSRLNGYIEVAGQRAQVVIANPSGITCNGCGFINANRATLTTGQAQMNNGNLTGFNVERGEVVVEGAGMDSSRQDYTEIIARSTKINAGLWANDLKVTTGRNKVDAAHQQIDKQSDDPATRPQLAVDVAKLGGMYAGKIRMIGTETGVGVRNAGNIGAQAGSVVVTADGRIENSGKISSGGDTQLASKGGVSNSGSVFAAGNAGVNSDGEVQNSGSIAARNHVRVQAASLSSSKDSTLAAGVQQDGKLGGGGELALTTSGKLTAQGQNLAAGDLRANGQGADFSGSRTAATNVTLDAGQGDLTTANAQVEATQQLTASGKRLNNDGGKLAANKLALNAHELSNRKGEITQLGGDDLTLSPQAKLDNAGGRIASNGNGLTLNAGSIDNQSGEIVHAGKGALTVNTARLQGDGGKLLSNGQLSMLGGDYVLDNGTTSAQQITLDVDSLSNRNGQLVQSGNGEMRLNTRRGIDNQGGQLAANGNVTLNAAQLNNQNGKVIAAQDGSLKAQVSGALDNRQGQLAASQHTRLQADKLDNRKGLVSAATGSAEVVAKQALDNGSGRIEAKQGLQLSGAGLENQAGQVVGGELALALGKGALNNQQGTIAATGDLRLNSGALTNDGGLLQSAGNMNMDTQGAALSNRLSGETGGILSQGTLTIHSGALDNTQGMLVGGTTDLFTGRLDNSKGTLVGKQTLNIDSLALTNDGGLLQAGGDATLNTQGQALTNRDSGKNGGISSLGKLTIDSGSVDNQGGFIASSGDLQLHGDQLDNRQGTLASEKHLSAAVNTLNNQGGAIKSGQDMVLNAKDLLDNSNLGVIGAGKKLQLDSDHLVNNQGTLVSADAAKINFGLLENQGGQLAAQTVLELHGNSLNNNDGGLIQSGDRLELAVDRLTNNHSGDKGGITSQGAMNLTTDVFDNGQGVVIAGKNLKLDAEALLNGGGKLVAQQALELNTTGSLSNQGGLVQSGADMQIDTHGQLLDNQNGTLHSLGQLQLSSGDFNNQGGTLGAKGDFTLAALKLDNSNGGRIIGEKAMTLTSAGLHNRNGQIQAVGNLLLDSAQGIIDNTLGLIRSGASVTLNALQFTNDTTQAENKGLEGQSVVLNTGTLSNRGGNILANQQLTLTNAGLLDNSGGQLAASGNLQLQGAALNLLNTAGTLKAGKLLDINATAIGGDGQLLSLGDIKLVSAQGINNSGEMIANGNFNFTTPGDVTNSGKLLAGSKLDLHANNLFNIASGEINAGQDWLTVNGTLTNYGLIDGKHTLLTANTLTNIGTGRIYGDAIGVQTVTFNNLAENGTAATLAGRERVDIGTQTLNNYGHGLIYSGGDMAIGGQLDANYLASGQAGTLNNHSSTIESAGNMALSAGQINNVNDHFSTELVTVSSDKLTEYQLSGSDKRYQPDEIRITHNEVNYLNTPDGRKDNYNQFDFNRTVQETQIKESDPAKIIAGGDMAINAGHLLNDKSQVVAGGTLAINAGSVDNVAVAGQRLTTDAGEVTNYYRIKKKGKDKQGHNATAYTPPTTIQTIALKPSQLIDHGQVAGNPIAITPLTPQGTDATIGAAAGVNAVVTGSDISAGMQSIGSGAIPVIQAVALQPGQQFEVANKVTSQQGDAVDSVVRIVGPDTRLPDNSLFKTNPAPGGQYLVETDPRFTNQKSWLGSDYMIAKATNNQDNVLKRLGDGYYEQRLIREQVINLTGQRYLEGYNNDEEQFKALMDQGLTFSQQYNLKVGVALTPEQMGLLTKDIVWLVNAKVTLPDGSQQNVLVPQVYARMQPGDLDGSGALIAGRNVNLNLGEGLFNSGHIAGREVVKLSAANITNVAGNIQGADVGLIARTDINNIGGVIQGNNSLLASAGRDINAISTTRTAQTVNGANSFERTNIDSVAGMYVQGADGKLMLQAGRDIKLDAAQVVNSGENGQTVLNAGRDLNLNTVTTASRDNLIWNGDNSLKQGNSQQVGSEVVGKGAVTLNAGNDLNARAATVSAGEALNLNAGHDINILSGENTRDLDERHKVTGGNGLMSKTTTTTRDSFDRQTAQGSTLSGESINVLAGNDLRVQGSSVAGTQDVKLLAGNDLTVTGATESNRELHLKQEKKSGLMSSGGIGISYGTESLKTTDTAQGLTNQGSTLGSVNGNLTLGAGNNLAVTGSELVAGKDMALSSKNVSVTQAQDQNSQTHKVEQKKSGLTLALSGTVGSALNTAVETSQQAKSTDDSRLAALQGTKAALSGVQAVQAARLAEAQGADPANNNMVGISISYGTQSSTSTQNSGQSTAQGSSLTAGNNLSITASGNGVKGQDGDITVQGSQLQAGKDVTLNANRDVNLLSAANTQYLDGKNESQGGTLGVGIGVGSGGIGLSVSASVNKGKGNEKGNGTTHTETTVNAGNQVGITSGRDTNLIGAQVTGESVKADVGRNLLLESQQDSDRYDSKQQNASAGGSFTFGSMTGSGSISLSKDKMHSNYDSVQEQTGIFAGKGGFDLTVGEHTQLNGAVIGSTATADKNKLDTGTLGFKDIHNQADFEVEHQSVGISSGGSIGSQFAGNMANGLLVGANNSGHDSSTTQSAVSDGTIIIRDQDKQTQNVSDLSRDVEHANQTLSPIFDKEKEQKRLQQAQLIGEIGNQAMDIARTEGAITATKAAKEKMNNVTDTDRKAAADKLAKDKPGEVITAEDINAQIYQTAYNQAFSESGYGTGGKVQRAMQAATAAVQGLSGGDLTGALANGTAPYITNVIANSIDDPAARVLAHAAVNGALAAAQGNNALVGAGGAATAELIGMIATEAYGKPVSELSETEKQTVSALATLAAGLAGGLIGDSSADAIAGAQTGKTVVENNWLSETESRQLDKELSACKASGGDCKPVLEKYIKISNKNSKELADACTGGGIACVTWEEVIQANTNVARDADPAQFRLSEKLKDPDAAALVNYLNGSDLKFLKDNITTGDRVLAVAIDPTSWPALVMGGKAIITNGVTKGKEQLIAVGVSGAANAAIQYGTSKTGEVKLSDVIGAGIIGAITAGKGYNPTVTWNAVGGYYSAEIKGDDPFLAALLGKAGASVGYVSGNIIKVPMDKILNPVSKQYEWVPTGIWTITKPAPQSSLPSLSGNIGDSTASGLFGSGMEAGLKEQGEKNEKK